MIYIYKAPNINAQLQWYFTLKHHTFTNTLVKIFLSCFTSNNILKVLLIDCQDLMTKNQIGGSRLSSSATNTFTSLLNLLHALCTKWIEKKSTQRVYYTFEKGATCTRFRNSHLNGSIFTIQIWHRFFWSLICWKGIVYATSCSSCRSIGR